MDTYRLCVRLRAVITEAWGQRRRSKLMASEAAALGVLKACKDSTVAAYVKLWTCFHCKLDHDTMTSAGVFCSSSSFVLGQSLTDTELAFELDKQLKRCAPKGYKENTETARG